MTFSADELEDGARAATGLDDFGSPYYREGLERTVQALNTEADLNEHRPSHPARHHQQRLAVIIPAVAADAVEGMSLLKVLKRADVTVNARRARNAAMVKFAIFGCALGYCVIGSTFAAAQGLHGPPAHGHNRLVKGPARS